MPADLTLTSRGPHSCVRSVSVTAPVLRRDFHTRVSAPTCKLTHVHAAASPTLPHPANRLHEGPERKRRNAQKFNCWDALRSTNNNNNNNNNIINTMLFNTINTLLTPCFTPSTAQHVSLNNHFSLVIRLKIIFLSSIKY